MAPSAGWIYSSRGGSTGFVSILVLFLTLFSAPAFSEMDGPVWPWMGEAFLDGFLEKDALRLGKYLQPLQDIGCEELTDLLLVQRADLDEMGMTLSEITRFENGVEEIRRWQKHQDQYAERWGNINSEAPKENSHTNYNANKRSSSSADGTNSMNKDPETPQWRDTPILHSKPSEPELDGWGIIAGDRESLRSPLHWRQRPIAALLGFMDQSQHMITETGKLDLKSMRAIQAMKSLSSSLSDTIQNLDQTLGINLATMKVDEILHLKENPAEMQRFMESHAERISGEISKDNDVHITSTPAKEAVILGVGEKHENQVWTSPPKLIEHVRKSIRKATIGISKLNGAILSIDGMSSSKVRHLLNNLCSVSGARYLEIGSFKGSTLLAAIFGNENVLAMASAIDNFSQFGGPKQEFWENVNAYVDPTMQNSGRFRFVEENAFSNAALAELGKPFSESGDDLNAERDLTEKYNVYVYDGGHSLEDHRRAFTHMGPLLAPLFIAVIDDWNQEQVKDGTREAFMELGWNVVYETELPSRGNGDKELWWNGMSLAVVQK